MYSYATCDTGEQNNRFDYKSAILSGHEKWLYSEVALNCYFKWLEFKKVLFSFQLEEFFYESDESDQELCKVAAECEEMVGEQPNHNSLGIQGSPIITECNREEVNALSSERSPSQDEEALLQVDNLQGVYQSTNCRKTCYKRTLEEPNTNGCRGFLETQDGGNSGLTFNERQTKREQIIGFSENNSSWKLSLENCCSDDKLDFTSDENVSVWLDEDPISDQELSLVAEEVENRS